MRVHWFQHVPFEGLGAIEEWLLARGHVLSCTRFHAGEILPNNSEGFDWLIVMGGPMNVYQYRDFPWLRPEKQLIREAIAAGKRVLGICLGAQLVADVMGGKVYQNDVREIGWFSVCAVPREGSSPFVFPEEASVFHWHGDTFSLPPGSVWLAKSEGCAHQAFSIGKHVLGLQFHLEMTAAEIHGIVETCGDELTPDRFVQSATQLMAHPRDQGPITRLLLLDRLLSVLEQG